MAMPVVILPFADVFFLVSVVISKRAMPVLFSELPFTDVFTPFVPCVGTMAVKFTMLELTYVFISKVKGKRTPAVIHAIPYFADVVVSLGGMFRFVFFDRDGERGFGRNFHQRVEKDRKQQS